MAWNVIATLDEGNVTSLRTWGAYLYAGCGNGKVYRSSDAVSWDLVWTDASGDPEGIWDLFIFGSYLYSIDYNGRVGRTNNGTTWANVYDLAGSNYGWQLAVHGSNLYAAGGAAPKIYRSANGTDWSVVLEPTGDHFFAIHSFDGYIYTVLDATTSTPGAIYRSSTGNLATWTNVEAITAGADQCRTMTVMDSYLYLNIDGSVKRTTNGTDYTEVTTIDGSGVGSITFDSAVYMNTYTGDIHRTEDGTTWEQDADIDSLGGGVGPRKFEEFNGSLYMSSANQGKVFVRSDAAPKQLISSIWAWVVNF